MIKKIWHVGLLFLPIILITDVAFSQLVINAGNDTIMCMENDSIMLGGNPTASNGVEPYKYEWSIHSSLTGNRYPASLFLSDSTSANPTIRDNLFTDIFFPNYILVVKLLVSDSIGNSQMDSIQIGISRIYIMTLKDCPYTIHAGDSVLVEVCNYHEGIPPFVYHWTPELIFSNPNSSSTYAKPDKTTEIIVEITDAIGCTTFETDGIYVIPVGINKITSHNFNSLVVPNPINEFSKITIGESFIPPFLIRIYGSNLKLVMEEYFFDNTYNVGKLIQERGLYYYIIFYEKEVVDVGKFLKI